MIDQTVLIVLGVLLLVSGLGFVVHRIFAPPERNFDWSLREWSAGRQPGSMERNNRRFSISFDAAGFTVTDLRARPLHAIRMQWREVVRITAFKRDLYAVDCICLLLEGGDTTGLEVDEDMEEWKAFCESLPRFLPGCLPFSDWLFQVATPAFEANPTEIYRSPAARNS